MQGRGEAASLDPVLTAIWRPPTSCPFLLQEFQDHMSGAQHQQKLGEIQHMGHTCLLSLLPVPRDVLERKEE